ncbi:MAG TPA: hypothetical protein VKQ72_19395, partial [Aggregatilineales bacterium]|nr:hypothetical protein [Aggregatilineales bacterium]
MSDDRFDNQQPPGADNTPDNSSNSPEDSGAQRPRVIKPLRPRPEQNAPTQGQPPRTIKKLPGKSAPLPPQQGDSSNPTSFEDWERAQNAPPPEPEPELPDSLLDEVPDWFQSSEPTPPGAAPAAGGAEFMPDWFAGLEEQSADEAPDWFKNVDLSGAALVGPESVQALTPAAPEPTPQQPTAPTAGASGDDAPDWFTGGGTGLEELDFNSMFAGGAEEQQPPLPSGPSDVSFTPSPSSEVIPPEQVSPVQADANLDWMSEMPDLAEVLQTGEPSAPAIEPLPPLPAEEVGAASA